MTDVSLRSWTPGPNNHSLVKAITASFYLQDLLKGHLHDCTTKKYIPALKLQDIFLGTLVLTSSEAEQNLLLEDSYTRLWQIWITVVGTSVRLHPTVTGEVCNQVSQNCPNQLPSVMSSTTPSLSRWKVFPTAFSLLVQHPQLEWKSPVVVRRHKTLRACC